MECRGNEKGNYVTAQRVDYYGKVMGKSPQNHHAVVSRAEGRPRLEQEHSKYASGANGKKGHHLL